MADPVVWRTRSFAECAACAGDAAEGVEALACVTCGRLVIDLRGTIFAACSRHCREVEVSRRRYELLAGPRLFPDCLVCGASILHRQRRARYCSGPCRQRAYEDRVRASGA